MSNPFGDPGVVTAIEYEADKKSPLKRDGKGPGIYRHVFPRGAEPVLSINKRKNIELSGGSYDYDRAPGHGRKLWLTNPPGPRTFSANEGENLRSRRLSDMAKKRGKKGRLSGLVLPGGGFVVSSKSKHAPHHRGKRVNGPRRGLFGFMHTRHNPPLTSFAPGVLIKRAAGLATGAAIYFGGKWALDKYVRRLDSYPKAKEGVLMGVGVAGGFATAYVVKDKWAGVGVAAVPVILGGIKLFKLFREERAASTGTPSTTTTTATTQRGVTVTDDAGRTIGRVISEVQDDAGRTIGHVIEHTDGSEGYYAQGRMISRIPHAIQESIVSGVSRITHAVNENVVARITHAVNENVLARIPVA